MKRRRRWWMVVALCTGGLLLWSRFPLWAPLRWPTRGRAPWGDVDIVAIGDSVTSGAGVPVDQTYPALLARSLGRRVRNAGVHGDTSLGGLTRLERDALRRRPSVVIIGFGLNDSGLYAPSIPPTGTGRFRQALTDMARRVRDAGATPVLLSPSPVDVDRARAGGLRPDGWAEYDRVARQVAEDEGVVLVDLEAAFDGDLWLLADGVHPIAEGYVRIAEAVMGSVDFGTLMD